MPTKIRTAESHVKLAAPELPAGIRSGGENHPLEYPHLYQIQAGDWRISYAVEHNRLAILVLEVLKADGESSKDPAGEKMTRKMKIKLLDWPEGSGNAQVPAEEISKKMKIKWLDMSQEGDESETDSARGKSRIKLKGAGDSKKPARRRTITLLDSGEVQTEESPTETEPERDQQDDQDRKVTPLDEPSM